MTQLIHKKAALIRDLQLGDVGFLPDNKAAIEALNYNIGAQLAALADKAQIFVVDADIDISMFQKEQVASYNAMIEAGVAKLPYPQCYFEYTANLSGTSISVHVSIIADQVNKAGNISGIDIHPLIQITNKRADGVEVMIGTNNRWVMGAFGWLPTSMHFSHNQFIAGYEEEFNVPKGSFYEKFGDDFGAKIQQLAGEIVDKKVNRRDNLGHKILIDLITKTAFHAVVCVMNMVVYLSTSAIPRTRYLANGKVLTNSKVSPKNSYTVIEVSKLIKQGYATDVGTDASTQRTKVRLHLRRGHTRRQRVGPGREQIKVIYIEPILVGYAEMGVIEHDYVVKR